MDGWRHWRPNGDAEHDRVDDAFGRTLGARHQTVETLRALERNGATAFNGVKG